MILLMSELIFLSKEQFQYWKTGHEPYSSQDHDSVGSTGSSAGSTRSSTGNGGNGSGGLGCAWILILPAAVILTGLLYIFIFNVIFDPLFGYFYKRVIMGKPAAEVALAWNITTTSVNAVISVVAAVLIYMALRPALKKADLFLEIK